MLKAGSRDGQHAIHPLCDSARTKLHELAIQFGWLLELRILVTLSSVQKIETVKYLKASNKALFRIPEPHTVHAKFISCHFLHKNDCLSRKCKH